MRNQAKILAFYLLFFTGNVLGQFEAEFNLSDINQMNGLIIHGANSGDDSGSSVSAAGDINNDGIDDLIIGAPDHDSGTGGSYVIYGTKSGLPSPFNLSTINGINGKFISGFAPNSYSGTSVSDAGDVNGDGIVDVIIGAPNQTDSKIQAGTAYVTFGNASNPLATGVKFSGINGGDSVGFSVSKAGDVNNDGISDIIIGAPNADPNDLNLAGSGYVVFGSTEPFPTPFNLNSLNGQNGFAIHGANINDRAGASVSAAGDVNGDGIDDFIISAPLVISAGSSYLIFGNTSAFANPLNLDNINGVNGITIKGINSNELSGFSVSGAGDVNGDGINDLIIGAPNFSFPGSAYLIFGNQGSWPNPINLADPNGSNSIIIKSSHPNDWLGFSVSTAGDVNADGIDDIIIGAPDTSPDGNTNAGSSYVIFGRKSGWPNPFQLVDLDGSNGFTIHGLDQNDRFGRSVSAAGDINGDGIDDLIIGAPNSGNSYVIYGKDGIFNDDFEQSN